MSHSKKKALVKNFQDSQRVISFVSEIGEAASYHERQFWKKQLKDLIVKLLGTKKQHKLDAALEYFYQTDLKAYRILLEMIESFSESCMINSEGRDHDVLLVVAPILAWTRFKIPCGPLSDSVCQEIKAALAAHLFTEKAQFILLPELYTLDQMPQSHADVFSLMSEITQVLSGEKKEVVLMHQESLSFLADIRYLIMAVKVPTSFPIFLWQKSAGLLKAKEVRDQCLENWKKQMIPLLSNIMPGCVLDLVLPDAFFETCRNADRQIRPLSIHAAVNYLTSVMDVSITDLRAVIGGFADMPKQDFVTEYRIGFSLRDDSRILYGVIWPVYDAEDAFSFLRPSLQEENFDGNKEIQNSLTQILSILDEVGILHTQVHYEIFPMEFCEECGSPLFADLHAELAHPELPETVKDDFQLH